VGNLTVTSEHLKDAALRNSSRILVAASAPFVAALSQGGASALPGLRVVELAKAAPLGPELLCDVALLVIEVDPADRASLQRVGAIREEHPHLLLVAAIENANVSLVRTLLREGISDVVSLPFELDELLQVTLDAVAKREAGASSEASLAPMIAVVRSIGGCGATSIGSHLAADMALHDPSGRGAVIADLDLQFGCVADYLGVKPNGSLSDLLEAQDRLDEELLRSVAAPACDGVAVIAAPPSIMPLESVDTDQLLKVIQLLRQRYASVVLDLPANWTNWTLSAALAADAVVLVVELSIASLRQAKRRLELFRSVGIEDDAVQIVVNRVEKRLFRTIDLDDVSATLRHPVLGSVALDAPLVSTAQNQGLLVSQVQRKSRFAKDVAELAANLRSGRLRRAR
jgi:pilus assembly protein CpaE